MKEFTILNFPAVTIRNSMERPEALYHGTIILTGFDPAVVLQSVQLVIDEYSKYCDAGSETNFGNS